MEQGIEGKWKRRMYNENLRPRSWERQRRAYLYLRRTHSHRLIPRSLSRQGGNGMDLRPALRPHTVLGGLVLVRKKQGCQCEEVLLQWTGVRTPSYGGTT